MGEGSVHNLFNKLGLINKRQKKSQGVQKWTLLTFDQYTQYNNDEAEYCTILHNRFE